MSKPVKLNNPRGHRFLDFRSQQAAVVIIVELLLVTFSVGVIWNHVESLGMSDSYETMAKTGLGMVEFIAIVSALWKLFARTKLVAFWAFWVNIAIVVMMLLHAGAVLRYEASGAEQKQTVELAADAQAKIAAATESARITAAAQEAARLNSMGQRATARRIANSASVRDDKGIHEVVKLAQNARRETFLPDWYMKGGMYVVPPLVAFLLLMFLVFISSGVIHIEDANQDGIPDFLQRDNTELAERHHAPRLEPQFGAHTAARPIQDRLRRMADRPPKS